MRTKLTVLAPAIVIAIATCLAYANRIPDGWFMGPWDKAGHLGLYGWLAASIALVLPERRRHYAFIGPLLLGALDELAQTLSVNRSPDAWDFVADAAGIAIGYAAACLARILPHFGRARHGAAEAEGA